jgi:hypothetical protein
LFIVDWGEKASTRASGISGAKFKAAKPPIEAPVSTTRRKRRKKPRSSIPRNRAGAVGWRNQSFAWL